MHDEGRRNSEYSYLPIPQLLTATLCVTTISINCQIDLSSLAYPSLHFALQNSQSFLADCALLRISMPKLGCHSPLDGGI